MSQIHLLPGARHHQPSNAVLAFHALTSRPSRLSRVLDTLLYSVFPCSTRQSLYSLSTLKNHRPMFPSLHAEAPTKSELYQHIIYFSFNF